jgi:hypothetical protein
MTGFYDRVQVAPNVSIARSAPPAAPDPATGSQPNHVLHCFLYELLGTWQPRQFMGRRPYGDAYNYLWSA